MFPESCGDNIHSLQPGSASASAPLAPPQAENGHARSDPSQTTDELTCGQNNNLHIYTSLGFKKWAGSLPQTFCVRRSPFYQTFCLSLFHPDPYLWAPSQAHTSFCTKHKLSISQPSCFFFLSLFFHGGLNARTTNLSPPPLPSFKSRDMVNQMKLCSNVQVLVVLCLAHLHLSDMEP